MDTIIDGLKYHIELCGEGFPLMLLHGFTGDSSTWTPFCATLGKHAKLIIPDIIGHGKSESPNQLNRYKIESAAKDLAGILDTLGVVKIDLMGYSMGGRLALTFAILYPERVRNLILESSTPGLSAKSEREERCMRDEKLAHFITEKGMNNFVDYWENIPLFTSMTSLPPEAKSAIRRQRLANSPQGLANSLRGMGTGSQPSWWEHLKQLECRVLLLTGSKDDKFCGIAAKMHLVLKNSSWVTVQNSGHAIHVEEKEKFGTIVSECLTRTY